MWYYIYLLGGIDMINNGWIDANGNIISVKENINDSAFNYCEKYLPPHIKNILHLYIIKYGKNLEKLSGSRKKEELIKIFSSVNKEKGRQLLIELKLDKYLKG